MTQTAQKRMDKITENRKKWLDALRSGEYRQGTTRLKTKYTDQFCCLGVLCDLYIKENEQNIRWEDDHILVDGEDYTYTCYPPLVVEEWVGLKGYLGNSVANKNDGGMSFEEIAKVLEESWQREVHDTGTSKED